MRRGRERTIEEYIHSVDSDEAARIRRFLYGVAVGTFAFVAVIVALVVTVPYWIGIVSHESERRFAMTHVDWVNEQLLTAADEEVERYVRDLGAALAAEMELPPDVAYPPFRTRQ